MKAFAMCLAVLFSISAYSQQTLWGTVQNGGQHGFGYLYRTDGNGDNLVVVHNFNGVDDGQSPGAVIQAGNGKIYGMTMAGGHGVDTTSAGNITQGGTLYEYDIQTDSFKVLIHFNSTDPQYPPFFHSPSEMRLLEVSPGKLWCVLRIFRYFNGAGQPLNRYITSYDIATNTLTPVTTVPGWNAPGLSDIQYTSIRGELYKAANGYVYGVTEGYAACATTAQTSIGSIIQINPANNAFSWIKPFNCINSVMDGWLPRGNFENVNGKFYSTTYWGGSYTVYPAQGFGVIYEYDPAANTYTKKHDFTNATGNGRFPIGYQVKAANGKLYGASGGGVAQSGSSYDPGIIYEFDPSTDTYTKKINFNPIFTAQDVGRLGSLWLAASNGKLYGTTDLGVFEYDPVNNSTRPAGRFASLNQFGVIPLANSMQEICRKPAYTVSSTTSYTLCTGSYFSHSLQCDNAQSFVWKRNGSIESAQTTGVLEFNSISTANAGNWTCEMTNACGTTTTQIISIAVNPGTGTSSTITTANTSICPNTSITISGNNGGVWNTGQTSPSINISGPGSFQVTNTNACGNTYSNIIIIDTIATPAFPVISFPPNQTPPVQRLTATICPGDSILLSGNINGTWNTGETSYSIYVHDQLPHFVTTSNQCITFNSDTAYLSNFGLPVPPVIMAAGPTNICSGDSVRLHASFAGNYTWYHTTPIITGYAGNGQNIYVHQTGNYFVTLTSTCGDTNSVSVYINADTLALDTAIITAMGPTTFCEGGSVTLQSNLSNCAWSTGATTQNITVIYPGAYFVTNSNSCSSVTSAAMNIDVIPAPVVTYTEPVDSFCLTSPVLTLAPGSPTGGTYSGPGVNGNTFDPAIGSGTHIISYDITDGSTGCIGHATQNIYVDYNPVIMAAGPTAHCAGTNLVLFQPGSPLGVWNTGATGVILLVPDTGTFFTTHINICGVSVTSNTITATVLPLPPAPVITQNGADLVSSPGVAYQWYLNGNSLVGATSQTYTPVADGDYTVYTQGPNGCYAVSGIFAVSTVGIQSNKEEKTIKIFPNPNAGMFKLLLPNGKNEITVNNVLGQTVKRLYTENETELDLEITESGVYTIVISNGGNQYVEKLIINRE